MQSPMRDTGTLCSQVLAPDLVGHLNAAGLSCRQAMKHVRPQRL